jgi:putative peptidoglycan lipid II flippase
MKQFFRRANQKLTVGWAAALLSGMSMLGMLLSLFRERLLNANFGVASLDLDAYRAAFKVPDFMFIVLVSGALSVTFIPVLTERLGHGNRKSAWELSSSLLNFLASVTLAASVFIMIFAGPIVKYLLAPGMDVEGQELATVMMRIIAINPFLFSISAVFTSIQQAVGRFFFFALAPATYSLGIIAGIILLAPSLGIIGVAYGVVIGSILQLIITIIGMSGLGFEYSNGINWRNLGFRRVLTLLPQRSVDQGIDYFNNLVEISLASRLRQGMINAWEVAFTLHWVPINLIGVAISTAAFPQMTERINQGRPDLFKKEFITLLRVVIWLALPTVIVAYFGRGYIVRLLVAEGNITIANLLGLLVMAMFFRAIFHLVSRSFYAQQDTLTPLKVSIAAIALNVTLAIYFVMPWGADLGVFGLALAQSIVAALEVVVLMGIQSKRFPGLFELNLFLAVGKMAIAAIFSGIITYALVQFLPLRATDVGFFALVPKFGLIVLLSLLSYLLASFVLGLKEAKPVIDRVRRMVFKPVRIQ